MQRLAVFAWIGFFSSGVPLHAQCQDELTAPDAGDDDRFGSSVAADGARVIVGAPYRDRPGESNAGAAYVFEAGPGGWACTDTIELTNGAAGDELGISVALDGERALVGAWQRDFGGPANTGVVYVYEKATNAWAQKATLSPSDASAADRFGMRVALHGDHAIVSSYRPGPAQVWLFAHAAGVWQEVAQFSLGGSGAGADITGLAIHGTTAMVGMSWFDPDDDFDRRGVVHVLEESGGVWSHVTSLQPDASVDFDHFGSSVAIDGARALIGCTDRRTSPGFYAGSAFVYERDASGWSAVAELFASTPENGSRFGNDVAIDGDHAIVGAPRAGVPMESGRAHLFRRVGGAWTEVAVLAAEGPEGFSHFGTRVSLRDHLAAVGNPGQDGAGVNRGAVLVRGLGASSNRCTSVSNSSGAPAVISHQGSISVSANNLRLVASSLPPSQFGIFFYGASAAELPFGDGFRCIGGQIFRYPPQSTQQGGVTRLLDLDDPPQESGRITAGSTWHFQFWFRDPAAGGAGWNLTDALEIRFCP